MNRLLSTIKAYLDALREYEFSSDHFAYRPIREEDADVLVSWRSDKDIIQYYKNNLPITLESHLKWYRGSYLPDDRRLDWVVWDGETPVGFVALTHIDNEKQKCEVNYTIGNLSYRHRGFGAEILNAVVKFGREKFGINRFVAEVHINNVASQRTAEKSGFVEDQCANGFKKFILTDSEMGRKFWGTL